MYLAEEDREGKEGATKISPGSTSSDAALVLVEAAATATLADEDDEELVSKAAAWLAASKNSHLLHLADAKSLSGQRRARSNPSRGSWSTYGSPRRRFGLF